MVSIENLRHFIAVVENQGIIKAAEKLFISPSSLTRSIQQIETQIGYLLFDRIGRNVHITNKGEEFYKNTIHLLSDFSSLLSGLNKKQTQHLAGHFKVGASHFLCEHVLAKYLKTIAKEYPSVSFEVYSLDSNILMKKIHGGDLDLGICFSPKPVSGTLCKIIHKGKLLLCAGKKHPLSGKKINLKKDLDTYPAIIHRPTESVERCDNHPMFKKFGIIPKIHMFWDSDNFATKLLENNTHWSMLPDIVINSQKDISSFIHPKEWHAPYEIGIIYNPKKSIETLKEVFLKLPFEFL